MKKMVIPLLAVMGTSFAMYKYFQMNPDKLNKMKNKMKGAVNTFEEEMMM